MPEFNQLIDAIKEGAAGQVEAILTNNPAIINQHDETGATPLHYATLYGNQSIVRLLVQKGAAINIPDQEFEATPTGWAIEYLRELGGHLAIELEDLHFAIQQADVKWTARFLQRFPGLKEGYYKDGKSFRQLAHETKNPQIIKLFDQ